MDDILRRGEMNMRATGGWKNIGQLILENKTNKLF